MRKVIQSNQQSACLTTLAASVHPSAPETNTGNKVMAVLKLWLERWLERRRLRARLTEVNTGALERDIGVPPGALYEEAHKPFWRG